MKALASLRTNHRRTSGRGAMPDRGHSFFTPVKLPPKITNEEATQQITGIVLGFSAGTLAKAAGRSKDSAKHWKAGHACPNVASIINLARQIPSVHKWLTEQISIGAVDITDDPRTLDALARQLADHINRKQWRAA